ncbi:MAG: nucleoside 2-deoxyribosyltransferase [Candidatus Gribaldobacteria bacterium]|nr:nucleoside 2-deoxyribosyltransferase [Candidatus Gribaldobacteria bacterium]
MKIFLAYKFGGEDLQELTETLGKILAVLRSKGHTVYCSIEDEQSFQENKKTKLEILQHAFGKLDESDLILAFVRSSEKSEGMLLEIGYMLAKGKPLALALQQGVKTNFIQELANPLIKFESVDDLYEKLQNINF